MLLETRAGRTGRNYVTSSVEKCATTLRWWKRYDLSIMLRPSANLHVTQLCHRLRSSASSLSGGTPAFRFEMFKVQFRSEQLADAGGHGSVRRFFTSVVVVPASRYPKVQIGLNWCLFCMYAELNQETDMTLTND